jgi:hypothetical protein
MNGAQKNMETMAVQQLGYCSKSLESGDGRVLAVRPNYGTCVIPSLFGAEIFYMEDGVTLPTNKPLEGGLDDIKKLIRAGVPDINGALTGRALETAEYYTELFKDYPKIQKYVNIYSPDTQGPIDILELLRGSGLFIDFYDSPETVKETLALITETHIRFTEEWWRRFPGKRRLTVNYMGEIVIKGKVMLRCDSSINFSLEMYNSFIRPFDAIIFEKFGGLVHFCGKGDHFAGSISSLPGVAALNITQPHLNDMEKIYACSVDRGLKLIALGKAEAERAIASGRNLLSNVHVPD